MIDEALKFLVGEINADFNAEPGNSGGVAVLGNIAQLDGIEGVGMKGKAVATIVNIEEEKTLKNSSPYLRTDAETVGKRNPTLYLNLYVLFSCPPDENKYEISLKRMSWVIGFFQKKNLFTAAGSPNFPQGVDQLAVDIHSTNFEQVNHLWGVLGGKYVTSVLYKLRLIAIQKSDGKPGPVVREIKADGNTI